MDRQTGPAFHYGAHDFFDVKSTMSLHAKNPIVDKQIELGLSKPKKIKVFHMCVFVFLGVRVCDVFLVLTFFLT